jgi:hypothetical protein
MTLETLPAELWDQILKNAKLKDLLSFQTACQKSRSNFYISSLIADRASRILLENMFSWEEANVGLLISGEHKRLNTSVKLRTKSGKEGHENYRKRSPLTQNKSLYALILADKTNEGLYGTQSDREREIFLFRPRCMESEINGIILRSSSRSLVRNCRDNRGFLKISHCGTDSKPSIEVEKPLEVTLLQISFPVNSEPQSPRPTFEYAARQSHQKVEFRDDNIVTTISTTGCLEAGWLAREGEHSQVKDTPEKEILDLMPSTWQQWLGSKLIVTARLHRKIPCHGSHHQLRRLTVEFCGLEIPDKGVCGWC